MATNKPQIKGYITEENAAKFKIIAKKQKRSTSNLIEVLVEKAIEEYENKYGTIVLEGEEKAPTNNQINQNGDNNTVKIANIGENNGTINMQ